MFAQWRESGLGDGSMVTYSQWVRRFRQHCRSRGLREIEECTHAGAIAFADSYRGPRRAVLGQASREAVLSSVHAWACALKRLGLPVPPWKTAAADPPSSPLLREYREFRQRHRGVAPLTLVRDLKTASDFLAHLRSRERSFRQIRILDLDAFVKWLGTKHSRRIVATDCSSLRCFLRFLQATGRVRKDWAAAVCSPRYRTDESPPRSVPWDHVRRILRSVPRGTPLGRRDFAMLLLMATYGLGGAEVVRMRLEDICWERRVLMVRRPKTGVPIELPLLPAVARAIATYLKHARPRPATAREVFVTFKMPHDKISTSALRHQIRIYACRAGVEQEKLGSHLFRHCHATRQVDWGASFKVVSDILGHRRPESTSVYIRVAHRRLRSIALPVPR